MNPVLTTLASVASAGPADKAAIEKVRSILITFEADIKAKLEEGHKENDEF